MTNRSVFDEEFVVSRRSKYEIDIDVYHGEIIEWKTETRKHNIKFGVEFVTHSSEENIVLYPHKKIESHIDPHFGRALLTSNGKVKLTWDNSFSKFTSKDVKCSVKAIKLASKNHINTSIVSKKKNAIQYLVGTLFITPYGKGFLEKVRNDGIWIIRYKYGTAYLQPNICQYATKREYKNTQLSFWESANERTMYGIELFLSNQFKASHAFFQEYESSDTPIPIYSLANAALSFLTAVMTLQNEDLEDASNLLRLARSEAEVYAPPNGYINGAIDVVSGAGSSLTNLVWNSTEDSTNTPNTSSSGGVVSSLTKGSLECTLIQAETYLLESCMNLLQESVIALVKAGLSIRYGWKLYQKCFFELGAQDNISPSVSGGIQFGVGTFNVIGSILPPIILKIVNVLGFPSDKNYGLKLANECFHSKGVRSVLAALVLLFQTALLPSLYCCNCIESNLSLAESILNEVMFEHPKSVIWMWYKGRMQRMRGLIEASSISFQHARNAQDEIIQLKHVFDYELAWNHMYLLQWERAIPYFEILKAESTWSKAFYAYGIIVCLFESGRQSEALKLLEKAPSLVARTFGGKTISVEQFVIGRSKEARSTGTLFLPGIELLYIWAAFSNISEKNLRICLNKVEDTVTAINDLKVSDKARNDVLSLCLLLKGTIFRWLGQWDQAEVLLEQAMEHPVTLNKHVAPYAMYELGMIWSIGKASAGNAVTMLKKAKKVNHDYYFKMRLHLRVHLSLLELTNAVPKGDEAIDGGNSAASTGPTTNHRDNWIQ